MNFFGERKVGEIISRFNDVSRVQEAISGEVLNIVIDSLIIIVGYIILYVQSINEYTILT